MFIIEKKYSLLQSLKNDHYIEEEFKDSEQWCKRCVYYGSFDNYPYNLCAKNSPEINIVSLCGHCDDFSHDKKINLLKYLSLRLGGYRFANKVR